MGERQNQRKKRSLATRKKLNVYARNAVCFRSEQPLPRMYRTVHINPKLFSIEMPLTHPFAMGITAAMEGQKADDCPYIDGRNRNDWLTGFFLAKPPFGIFVIGKFAC